MGREGLISAVRAAVSMLRMRGARIGSISSGAGLGSCQYATSERCNGWYCEDIGQDAIAVGAEVAEQLRKFIGRIGSIDKAKRAAVCWR